jgi:hypothetical protein
VVIFTCIAFLFGLAWFFWTQAGCGDQLPGWLGMPANYYRDAFLVAVAGAAACIGFGRLVSFVATAWPTLHEDLSAVFPSGFDALSPAAQAIAGSVYASLLYVAGIAALAGFIAARVKALWMRALFVIVAAIALMNGWGSAGDFAQQFLIHAATLILVWWGVSKIVRFNLLAYFLLTATLLLLSSGISLVRQPSPYLHNEGVIVLGALTLLHLWPLVAWRRATTSRSLSPENPL